MKLDVYKINNAVEKIKTGKNTQFLDGRELKIVTGKLKKVSITYIILIKIVKK